MKFKTSITHIKDGKEVVRGHELSALVQEKTFPEAVFLILSGRLPKEKELRLWNAMLTSVIDHGPGVASAMNARISASADNPIHASLAAGLLGFGKRHGMAVEGAMEFFYAHEKETDLAGLLAKLKEQKVRVPGYGHKVFTESDPRTETLFAIAHETGIAGVYCTFAKTVQETLNSISSKKLPLNVDGAIAAILCDMGFSPAAGNAVFLIGRVPGLLAHILEEEEQDEGIRRLPEEDITYTG